MRPTEAITQAVRDLDRWTHGAGLFTLLVPKAMLEVDAIRHAARVLTNPLDYTTDEYVKASALLKALAEEGT